jgi:hypothetical protein
MGGAPVIGFFREDPADAASGIGHIAGASGNDVDMGVRDGLTGRATVVETDGECVHAEAGLECGAHFGDEIPECGDIGLRQIKETGGVAARDNEGVALGDWKAVPESECGLGFEPETAGLGGAKRADGHL